MRKGKGKGKVIVLCKNPSLLFEYAKTLNKIGYYSLSLCGNVKEVVNLLEAGRRFEYLIYDAFDQNIDAYDLKEVAGFRAICSIIAISDVNSQQRQGLIQWAKIHEIPFRGVLQMPLRAPELHEMIGGL